MVNLAPADISKQIPAWSLMTSAYLFRDAAHLKKTFKSDVGRDFIKMAKDKLGLQIITPVYFGSRNVNLKPDRQIKTPADLAGVKLRMPPGEFWQFLGESIGANPVPVACAEVYTALQSGAIDGQDNPLVASKLMKFYEVMTQFVMTGHVIGYDVMSISSKIWDAMSPAQQTAFQAAAEKAIANCLSLPPEPSTWLDRGSHRPLLGMAGALGSGFHIVGSGRNPIDIVYGLVSERTRRTFTVISSLALVALFVVSLPASWSYVLFMKREKSAFLGMRFDYLYSIYVIFAVACIVNHVQIAWNAFRGRESPEVDALEDRDRI